MNNSKRVIHFLKPDMAVKKDMLMSKKGAENARRQVALLIDKSVMTGGIRDLFSTAEESKPAWGEIRRKLKNAGISDSAIAAIMLMYTAYDAVRQNYNKLAAQTGDEPIETLTEFLRLNYAADMKDEEKTEF